MKSIGELLKRGYSEARVQQINFKFYLHVFTSCYKHFFSSCIDICLSNINICLSCIGICFKLTFVLSCYLQVGTRCLCVTICLQVVTRVYNVLQVHVSTRSEITFGNDVSPCSDVTFGNDVALRKALRKKGVKNDIIYY